MPATIHLQRMNELRRRMTEQAFDVALITDDDNVYYLTGYYDYLHMEFGRPTILVVPRDGESLLITPAIDLVMAQAHATVDRIAAWNDGAGNEWREELPAAVRSAASVAIEPDQMPPPVRTYLDQLVGKDRLRDVTPLLAEMRMIKSEQEQQLARHAGEVAGAMMAAGREATVLQGLCIALAQFAQERFHGLGGPRPKVVAATGTVKGDAAGSRRNHLPHVPSCRGVMDARFRTVPWYTKANDVAIYSSLDCRCASSGRHRTSCLRRIGRLGEVSLCTDGARGPPRRRWLARNRIRGSSTPDDSPRGAVN